MLVVSYNPGYQNMLKSLKPSTRQRFLAIDFDFPDEESEQAIVARESGLSAMRCAPLVHFARRLRNLKTVDLEEGCSTRLVIYAASLIAAGMKIEAAVLAAMIEPLTDDPQTRDALKEIASICFG
jgi:nitric oxide reductase NorQ protein